MSGEAPTPESNCLPDTTFVKLLTAIIVGWVLVQLWVIFIKALAFQYAGLDKNSALHTFIVAAIATILFIAYLNCMEDQKADIQSKMTGISIAPYSTIQSVTG